MLGNSNPLKRKTSDDVFDILSTQPFLSFQDLFTSESISDINVTNSNKETLLMIACQERKKDHVNILIANGADLQLKCRKNETALEKACEIGDTEIILLLEKNGANLYTLCRKSDRYLRNAFAKRNIPLVFLLHSHKATILYEDKKLSATSYCCCIGDLETLKELIQYYGCSVSKVDEYDNITLSYALNRPNRYDCAEFLLEQLINSPNYNQSWYDRLIETVCDVKEDCVDLVRLLIRYKFSVTYPGCRALMLAIKRGHRHQVTLLLINGANVNEIDQQRKLGTPLIAAVNSNDSELIIELIARGANVNETVPHVLPGLGQTALIAAVKNNNLSLVDLLLTQGAGINVLVDNISPNQATTVRLMNSAYTTACLSGNIDMINRLREKGAHHIKGGNWAMLNLATVEPARREAVLNILLDQGISINCKMGNTTTLMAAIDIGIDTWFIDLVISKGGQPNYIDERGKTALHIFLEFIVLPRNELWGNVVQDVIKCFLEHKTDVLIDDNEGRSAFSLSLKGWTLIHEMILPYVEINKTPGHLYNLAVRGPDQI